MLYYDRIDVSEEIELVRELAQKRAIFIIIVIF